MTQKSSFSRRVRRASCVHHRGKATLLVPPPAPKGRRSAERRTGSGRVGATSGEPPAFALVAEARPLLADALAFRRSTAALAEDLAAHGSVRSRASWSRTTDPAPGSQLLADLPIPDKAGRQSFRTARVQNVWFRPRDRPRSTFGSTLGRKVPHGLGERGRDTVPEIETKVKEKVIIMRIRFEALSPWSCAGLARASTRDSRVAQFGCSSGTRRREIVSRLAGKGTGN
jgi:hypothetical protein